MNKSAIFVAILAVFLFTTLVTVDSQNKPGPGGYGGGKKLVKRDVSSNKAFISDELEFDKGE